MTLDAPTDGQTSGCAVVGEDLIKRIGDTPEDFYVNIHNDQFGDGAIRGQLK